MVIVNCEEPVQHLTPLKLYSIDRIIIKPD